MAALLGGALAGNAAAAAPTETVLYSFDTIGGGFPGGDLLLQGSGTLIGTASGLGSNASPYGQVFMLKSSGKGWTFKRLHAFDGQDGATPMRGLTAGATGSFYGTTSEGGASNKGTVFELTKGAQGWTETVLADLQAKDATPEGRLLLYKSALYGTTVGGNGSAFKLVADGRNWKSTILETFSGDDGKNPLGGLIRDPRTGVFYGTTEMGGVNACGNVFALAKPGGKWKETTLYSFRCGKDGADPESSLVEDSSGALYGTTYYGGNLGAGHANSGAGTVFKLGRKTGKWTETVLYSFVGNDGEFPEDADGLLLGKDGALYGTTSEGGEYDRGIAFRLTIAGGAPQETVLHSFGAYGDGEYPEGGVIQDAKSGTLYGTTFSGGAYGYGAVWKIVP
ncbi:MAG TPA: choice-of-anchor tandem repeat GloVer-containing protein [Rhizomicrobium sp.]